MGISENAKKIGKKALRSGGKAAAKGAVVGSKAVFKGTKKGASKLSAAAEERRNRNRAHSDMCPWKMAQERPHLVDTSDPKCTCI